MIPLGPFDLDSVVGRGGMAEVWRGHHREQRVPIALKVLTHEKTQESSYQSAFRNEVRAVASLDHPNVVMVYDYGVVPPVTEVLSQGRLRAGCPYLVMEWAGGGSLRGLSGRLPWPKLRGVLLCLLDALAHAHARKVIHRDLKPENVLLRQGRSALMLTDFGLAHAFEQVGQSWEHKKAVGTPAYMAPEQFESRWRDYGPWTDLYALGCLSYTLACGHPPFGRDLDFQSMRSAHLYQTMPPLKPDMRVPLAFEEWLKMLLEKDPERRFLCAADAAWALRELPEPDRGPYIGPDGRSARDLPSFSELSAVEVSFLFGGGASKEEQQKLEEEETGEIPMSAILNYPAVDFLPGKKRRSLEVLQNQETLEVRSIKSLKTVSLKESMKNNPKIPDSWHRPATQGSPLRLLGVGLGLYGLRSVPLVDREEERDALWKSLREVRSSKRAQAILLHGPSGCGKSRLAEWLCERAHESGAAYPLKVHHSPIGGPSDGIAPAIARHFRCRAMSRVEIQNRLEKVLRKQGVHSADEWLALTELIHPAGEQELKKGGRLIRFRNVDERYVLIRRFLSRLCLRRPVILWLDDVHWGLDAIGLASYILDIQKEHPLPVLFVMTAQKEALAERVVEQAYLEELKTRHGIPSLEIGLLPERYRSVLIRELLGLEGELAVLVEERTEGNPLFAVRLVEDWVQRGMLEVGERGFRLKEGVEIELPDSLYQVWRAQIEGLLLEYGESDGIALELAAVLGQTVDVEEWSNACGELGLKAPFELLEQLISRHLVTRPKRSFRVWSFVHSMVRESLERRAKEGKRWEELHKACVNMLQRRKGAGVAQRRGLHMLAAGLFYQALAPLALGVQEKSDTGEFRSAELLLKARERALLKLEISEEHVHWGRQWLLYSRLARLRGELAEAAQWARQTDEMAQRSGSLDGAWLLARAQALVELGQQARMFGDLELALTHLQEAERLAEPFNEHAFLTACRRNLGRVWMERGELDLARGAFLRALFDSEALEDPTAAANCNLGLGSLSRQAGFLEESISYLEKAKEQFARCGARGKVADCINTLGEIARFQGDFAKSEELYRQALRRYRDLGTASAIIPELNLGLLLVEQERYEEARLPLERCLISLQKQKRRGLIALCHVCLLPGTADRQDWLAWEHHLQHAIQLLEESMFVDIDIARICHLAGDIAYENEQTDRAIASYQVSFQHWLTLDRPEEAGFILELIQRIRDGAFS